MKFMTLQTDAACPHENDAPGEVHLSIVLPMSSRDQWSLDALNAAIDEVASEMKAEVEDFVNG